MEKKIEKTSNSTIKFVKGTQVDESTLDNKDPLSRLISINDIDQNHLNEINIFDNIEKSKDNESNKSQYDLVLPVVP